MDRDRQRAIAAHELFHARRGDWVALVLEELLKAVLFFHPAVHWLVGRVRLAREQTVDAAVVRRLGAREVYLESLLEVARQGIRARAVPAAPFLRESHLRERVDLLLKEVVMSRARTQINAGITAAAILLAVSWAVSAAPLQNAPQQSSESKPSPDKAASGEPKLLHKVDPVYPEAAKADKAEGMFQVAIVVGKDGGVRDATVVASSSTPGRLDEPSALNGDPRLAQAALEAVRLWRYEPILKNGQPVEAKMTITINFRLS
jgi:D-alanyl-D-alanine endopeptidase (penicillin-binding protein 7)